MLNVIKEYIASYLNPNPPNTTTREPNLKDLVVTGVVGGTISTGLAAGGFIAVANSINTLSRNTLDNYEDLFGASTDLLLGVGIFFISSTAFYFTHKFLSSTWAQIQEKNKNASLEGRVISQVPVHSL